MRFLLLLLALTVVGCGEPPGPGNGADAARPDASRDAAVRLDAGEALEADASVPDSGGTVVGSDAGPGADGGAPADAEVVAADTGFVADSGGTSDVGAPGDTGSLADAAGLPDVGSADVGGFADAGAADGSSAGPDAGAPDAGAGIQTTIRVHYDTGMGNRIALRGSPAPLDWVASTDSTWTTGNVWTYATTAITSTTELKPVFVDAGGAMTWAMGANWKVEPGQTLDVYPFFFTNAGTVESFDVSSSFLGGGTRKVEVYLPPSYHELGAHDRTYPVLVMQDGQNLFDPSAFFGGWALDDSLDSLLRGDLATGGVLDVIVVAPDNGGIARIYEYTPTADPGYCDAQNPCGGADTYLDFVAQELMPEVRTRYRVAAGRVGIAGSSLGGLVSLYACWTRPAEFDRCGIFSPSLWWDSQWMPTQIASDTGPKRDLLLYLDAGTSGDGLSLVQALATDLITKPNGLAYTFDQDLMCLKGIGHEHNEVAWKTRAPWALEWLYADPTRVQPAPQRPAEVVPCLP